MTARSSRWVVFTPRDTIMIRDGRSFDAGGADASAHRAHVVNPWPSTVAGALTTALAASDDRTLVEFAAMRGPVLAHCCDEDAGSWTPYFSVPADVYVSPGPAGRTRAVSRLVLSKWGSGVVQHDLDDGPEQLLVCASGNERHEPLSGLLSASNMMRYLAGDLPQRLTVEESPLRPETRVGLAREGRTAKEGYLYSSTHLRADSGWGLLIEYSDSDMSAERVLTSSVPLGGKARLADVEVVTGVSWPKPPASYPGGRVLLYVVTPAVWPAGWRPPLPERVGLVAAAVPAPVPVPTSSVRTARRDRTSLLDTVTLRWAVPAGAVYLLRFPGDPDSAARDAQAWASRLHGRALGPGLDPGGRPGDTIASAGEPGTDRTSTAGFGVVLTGTWGGSDDR
jgi:CRISPR type III-B/RAMP module-associated protein Cmr3